MSTLSVRSLSLDSELLVFTLLRPNLEDAETPLLVSMTYNYRFLRCQRRNGKVGRSNGHHNLGNRSPALTINPDRYHGRDARTGRTAMYWYDGVGEAKGMIREQDARAVNVWNKPVTPDHSALVHSERRAIRH